MSHYHQLTKVDDLAFQALKVSIPEPERSILLERLRADWAPDVGAIGIIRQVQLETRSITDPARLYWSSRREPGSPRIESLLSSFLINLASSVVYDVIKDLMAQGYFIQPLLSTRQLSAESVASLQNDTPLLIRHAIILYKLFKMKASQDKRVIDIISETAFSENTLENLLPIENGETFVFFDNIELAARGLIYEELRRADVHVATKADGVLVLGLPVAGGFGRGATVAYTPGLKEPSTPYVLAVPPQIVTRDTKIQNLMEAAQALLSWDCGMTSHFSVTCRSIRRPAVVVEQSALQMLLRKPFLVVEGSNGTVRGFENLNEN